MKKLVVTYSWGDESCCGESIVPLEYESEEAFSVEFEEAIKDARQKREYEIGFAGHVWPISEFFFSTGYYPPNIQTLDEWFEENKWTLCTP